MPAAWLSRSASTRWSPSPWPRSPTADIFGFDHGDLCAAQRRGAIAPASKRADILLLDDLAFTAAPHRVYSEGELVAEDGAFVGAVAPAASRPGLEDLEEDCAAPLSCPNSTSMSFPTSSAPASRSST